jgi:iron(II)-dependent oxidoreductase
VTHPPSAGAGSRADATTGSRADAATGSRADATTGDGPAGERTPRTEDLRQRIVAVLERARFRTVHLTQVAEPDLTRQHCPLMSPLVWDLAHVGNVEELWLLRRLAGREPMQPEAVDRLYNAFEHPRRTRVDLPLLDPATSRRYLTEVRSRVLDLVDRQPLDEIAPCGHAADGVDGPSLTDGGFVFGMVAQHEQQHDETMLATHQFRPGAPVLGAPVPAPAPPDAARLPVEVLIPAGEFEMGTSLDPWALDNERPAHRVHVPAFWLDTTPVSNAAYQEFVIDGGYRDARWWTPAGWQHCRAAGLVAPLFWWREGGLWLRRRFGRVEPVPPEEPVLHVCWYEADAYARWAGRRLPTEGEWEKAARHDPVTGWSRTFPWGDDDPTLAHANLGQRHLQPAPVGSYPDGASAYGVRQLLGDVWEWTSSDFTGYPGFVAWPYREYSDVFFGTEYKVLRGGSFAADPVAVRGTFRNWDYPIRRQIFCGFRCARDAAPGEG